MKRSMMMLLAVIAALLVLDIASRLSMPPVVHAIQPTLRRIDPTKTVATLELMKVQGTVRGFSCPSESICWVLLQ